MPSDKRQPEPAEPVVNGVRISALPEPPPLPAQDAGWNDPSYAWPPPPWWAGARPTAAQLVAHAASPYQTRLTPALEREFRQWKDKSGVPYDPSAKADYDMRGFFLALRNGEPAARAAVGNDGQVHFPDKWKTPYHATFSDKSMYAVPGAPSWHGDTLVSGDGARIVADERPTAALPARYGNAVEIDAINRLPPPPLAGEERFDAIDKRRAGAPQPFDDERERNPIDFGHADQGGE